MINLVFEVSSYRFVNASFSLLGGLSGRLLPTHRTNVDISGWLFLPPVSCHYQMNDMARFHCIGSRYPQTVRRICLSPPPVVRPTTNLGNQSTSLKSTLRFSSALLKVMSVQTSN